MIKTYFLLWSQLRLALSQRVMLLTLCLLAWTPLVSAGEDGYKMGVFPYFAPTRLEEIYAPVAAELSSAIGKPVRFRTAPSFAGFFENLREGSYDIALLHPFYYIPAADEFAYLPLVRVRERFRAVLVSLDTSKVRDLDDLRGRIIASPPAHGTSVHMIRQAIRDRGLLPDQDMTFREFSSVGACLQQLMIGEADACVSGPVAARRFEQRNNISLHTIVESNSLPGLVFVVHPRVVGADREHMREILVELNTTEQGREILARINIDAFVPAEDSDYDEVRRFVSTLEEPWLPQSP
jgi:phosphonate transport system substrate-binding protein